MATREENIKKINAKLEAMSDSELDQVAGGTYSEVAGDSRFLNDIGTGCDRYGATRTFFEYGSISDEVSDAWKKVGVTMVSSWGGQNKYFDKNNNEISRNKAMKIAAKAFNKDFTKLDMQNYF